MDGYSCPCDHNCKHNVYVIDGYYLNSLFVNNLPTGSTKALSLNYFLKPRPGNEPEAASKVRGCQLHGRCPDRYQNQVPKEERSDLLQPQPDSSARALGVRG
jgi:hypothetical protein